MVLYDCGPVTVQIKTWRQLEVGAKTIAYQFVCKKHSDYGDIPKQLLNDFLCNIFEVLGCCKMLD